MEEIIELYIRVPSEYPKQLLDLGFKTINSTITNTPWLQLPFNWKIDCHSPLASIASNWLIDEKGVPRITIFGSYLSLILTVDDPETCQKRKAIMENVKKEEKKKRDTHVCIFLLMGSEEWTSERPVGIFSNNKSYKFWPKEYAKIVRDFLIKHLYNGFPFEIEEFNLSGISSYVTKKGILFPQKYIDKNYELANFEECMQQILSME